MGSVLQKASEMEMARRQIAFASVILMLSSLSITVVSAAVYYALLGTMNYQATLSPVVFTSGDDTSVCGGSLSTNSTIATFTTIPLAVESQITITELVNVTNTDSSAHSVQVSVGSENFGSQLTLLRLYLVSPSGTETLVVELDTNGAVTTQGISVTIPAGQEYAMKLVGYYDSGTAGTQTNTMTLNLQVTG